jgi:hypothetical protein
MAGNTERRKYMKVMKGLVAVACMVATLAVAQPASAGEYLPHNVATTDSYGNCAFQVQHGNYIITSYSKVRTTDDHCLSIRVTNVALKDGQLVSASRNVSLYGQWTQASVDWANIVGTQVEVCAWNSSFTNYSCAVKTYDAV